MKSKVTVCTKTGENQWKDKTITKYFLQFEDGNKGIYSQFPGDQLPEVGLEYEYEQQDKGFGPEVKIQSLKQQKSVSGGGRQANPRDKGLASAVGIVKSLIEAKAIANEDVEVELKKYHHLCTGLITGEINGGLPF